tara:strand:+ start:11 stop:130 length:120 start_codon:yes stop_codon:yes gene_type:complete
MADKEEEEEKRLVNRTALVVFAFLFVGVALIYCMIWLQT